MKAVQRSDVGRVRSVNEDMSSIHALPNGYTLAIVADGMGGHLAGETASRLAVETVSEQVLHLDSGLSLAEMTHAIRDAILRANHVIYELSSQDMKYHNMGTTIVAVLLSGDQGVIAHIGDSRAYRIVGKTMTQITEDHSLVNELLKSGQISFEESLHHPRRNVLTRALGTDFNVEVEMNTIQLAPRDILLLCTDGLSNRVSVRQMIDAINEPMATLDSSADTMVQLALQAGGEDNITLVLLEQTDGCSEIMRGGSNA